MKVLDVRERLRKNLALAMTALSDQLSAGRPPDFPSYQRVVGNIKGLRDAIYIVDQVFELELNEEGEDDDLAV